MLTLPTHSRSQSLQDVFAFNRIGNLGTYIEIGAQWPEQDSNTFALESFHGWSGFSVEMDKRFESDWWSSGRRNPCYWANALTFDFAAAAQHELQTLQIDYLSCDIEPPEQTLNALTRVIEQGIIFTVITFEHDTYRCGDAGRNVDAKATAFLQAHGYKIAVSDVYWQKPENVFETWYVRQDDPFVTCTYADWKTRQIQSRP